MKYIGNSGGKIAVSYSFNGNFFYIYFKKHICRKCSNKLKVKFITDIPHNSLNSSNWAGTTYYADGVEKMKPCFYCKKCDKTFSIEEIKKREKNTENG